MVGGGARLYKEEPFLPKHNSPRAHRQLAKLSSRGILVCTLVYFGCKKDIFVNLESTMAGCGRYLDSTGHPMMSSMTRLEQETFSTGYY